MIPTCEDGSYRINGPLMELPRIESQPWGNLVTKSVKFIERPGIEELIQEHELIKALLARVIDHDGDLDLCIRSSAPLPPQNNPATWKL